MPMVFPQSESIQHAVVIEGQPISAQAPKKTRTRTTRPRRMPSEGSTASSASSFSRQLTLSLSRVIPACALVDASAAGVHGSFAPTSPVTGSLRALAGTAPRARRARLPLPVLFVSTREPSLTRSASSAASTPLDSPMSPMSPAPSLPSISRTTSDDDLPVPAARARAASLHVRFAPRPPSAPRSPTLPRLDSGLAALEDASRLRTRCRCAHCGNEGYNFPRARTGEVWCSRECRVAARAKSKGEAPSPA